MAQQVFRSMDVKIAAVLSGSTAILAAVTVPLVWPSVSELIPATVSQTGGRDLPLPLPLFSVALAVQIFLIYGLFAFAGLRLARARGLEPAPLLSGLWTRRPPGRIVARAASAFVTGLLCGVALVAAVAAVRRFLPETLPRTLHPSSVWGALLASATASFGEEILCRLFLLSALLRILPASPKGKWTAVLLTSLLFGLLHAPAAVFLFGGLANVPHLFWVWMIALNALVGVACSWWYLRIGIGGAIAVHWGTDLVWHVLVTNS